MSSSRPSSSSTRRCGPGWTRCGATPRRRSWPSPTIPTPTFAAGSTPRLGGRGARCRRIPSLQAKVNGWIEKVVSYLAEEYGHEIADLIATTVARWDGAEASRRIELQVGRDLQFIRINGTVVGGLAGLAIYSIGQLL